MPYISHFICQLARRWGGQPAGRGLRVAVPVLLCLFVLAVPARSYLWEQDQAISCLVRGLRVTDVRKPNALRLEWEYTPLGSSAPQFEVQRKPVSGSTWTSLTANTTDHFYEDTGFTFGTSYQYRVRVAFDTMDTMGLPAPPMGADPDDIYTRSYADGLTWITIDVTPVEVTVTENQAVDSRLDLRYSTNVLKDFRFGSRVYRGGLWAGFASDPSRVGRSFGRWELPALPSGSYVWTARVNAYHTASVGSGTTTVGCHPADPSWTAADLKWSNAPAMTPGSPTDTDTADPMNPGWLHWNLETAVTESLLDTGLFATGWASTNEASTSWAYFAKKEYDAALAPRVTYAYTGSNAVWKAEPAAYELYQTEDTTVTVSQLACSGTGGTTVPVSASPAGAVSVPTQVVLPVGAKTAQFQVYAQSVSCPTPVVITVGSVSFVLMVYPY